MELRHLRYFVAVGEDQHYGRAAQRLRIAQPALSRQIQDLEEEIGFKLFDRLSRGVKISAAGKLFLEDARRILQQVNEATTRAARVAHGKSVRSGRLDAGFVYNVFDTSKADRELDKVQVGTQNIALAAPKGNPLTELRNLRLRDMGDASFIWFPRRESPAFYDRLMRECFRGGLKTPRIVQEAVNEATILSLVSHGLGVGFVNGTARWRCPKGVVVLPVSDLNVSLQLALVWRKNNASPLLARFVAGVQDLPQVNAHSNG